MLRRFAALLAAIIIALACALPSSLAATKSYDVYVTSASVEVYQSPNTSSNVLTTVPFGVQMQATATLDEWTQLVSGKGAVGYCLTEGLSTKDPNTYNTIVYIQTESAAVYQKPSTKAKKITTLKRNQTLTATAISNEMTWVRVKLGEQYGYIQKPYIDDAPYTAGTKATVLAGSASTAVHAWPDGTLEMGSARLGDTVYIVESAGNRTKIRSSAGFIGYITSDAISTSNPYEGATVYAQVSGNYLLKSMSDNSGSKITAGTQLTVVAIDQENKFACVKVNGKRRYVPYIYIAATKPSGSLVLTAAESVDIFEKPSLSSERIATVPSGTRFKVLSGGRWGVNVQTTVDGKTVTGWVLFSLLKAA